jgi:hypothetical protein
MGRGPAIRNRSPSGAQGASDQPEQAVRPSTSPPSGITRAAVLLFAMLACTWASGMESPQVELIPADFHSPHNRLQKRITFPYGDNDVAIVVLCEAIITERGRFDSTMCRMRNGQTRAYERAIVRSAASARAAPARVNGVATQVWVQFSVFFERTNEKTSITVYGHHFLETELYGVEYTAPQRYTFPPWPDCELQDYVWIAYTVDRSGRASDLALNHGKTPAKCADQFSRRVLNSQYIPAFQRSRAVSAKVLEPFWLPRFVKRL